MERNFIRIQEPGSAQDRPGLFPLCPQWTKKSCDPSSIRLRKIVWFGLISFLSAIQFQDDVYFSLVRMELYPT